MPNTSAPKKRKHQDPTPLVKRVRGLIREEFIQELALKNKQLDVINCRLSLAKKLLNRLRISIVSDYYHQKGMPSTEIKCMHPTFAKINGKTRREFCKTDTSEEESNQRKTSVINSSWTRTTKVLNATRLNNKVKHSIIVGNTSKYISPSKYKWVMYVKAQSTVETCIKKVRFHLDQSYGAHNVVDLYSPPYQLSASGWGEFPVRIQLFFEKHLKQKPLQLFHKLVLDKTLSGIHTLGAETIVHIWLPFNVPKLEENCNMAKSDGIYLPEIKADPCEGTMRSDLKTGTVNNVRNVEACVNVNADVQTPKRETLARKIEAKQKEHRSLLKSRLDLYRQNQNNCGPINYQSWIHDHDYISAPQNLASPTTATPQLHFGMRQKRIDAHNARELLMRQQHKFERDFLQKRFASILEAVEFLLRRSLKTQTAPTSSATSLFDNCMINDFQSLSEIGQKSHEWLRAKCIQRFTHKHKDFLSCPEGLWTTREIVIFARLHFYTSHSKMQNYHSPKPLSVQLDEEFLNATSKTEPYTSWITSTNDLLTFETSVQSDGPIDVVNMPVENSDKMTASIRHVGYKRMQLENFISLFGSFPNLLHLENELGFVNEICAFLNIPMSTENKTAEDITCPSSLVLLAQCLRIFIDRLLRRAIALKVTSPLPAYSVHNVITVQPNDLTQVILQYTEFDFLVSTGY